MNKTLPHLLSAIFAVTTLHAVTPESLELDEAGTIHVFTDKLEGIRVSSGMQQVVDGTWVRTATSPASFENQVGGEVERVGMYGFNDGSDVELTVKAKIEDSQVMVNAAWPNQSSAPGFTMLVLNIPQEIAEDLTIEADGSPVFRNFENNGIFVSSEELLFRRTSTDEFLFKMTGDNVAGHILFNADDLAEGLSLRSVNGTDPNNCTISDSPTIGFTLSFKE